MIKSIEKDHVCVRQTGVRVAVRLTACKKGGAYVVSKGPNLKAAELPCRTLEEVFQYGSKGYMIRMHGPMMEIDGKRRRINGLYSSEGIEVIR